MQNNSLSQNVSEYMPDNELHKGYGKIFKSIFKEFWDNRWLIWQLYKRDFIAHYRQSFIGFFWAILLPLISAGTFIILNRSGIFQINAITIPYPLFAVFGLMNWQIFASGLLNSSEALVKAGSMIVKINISKKSLVLAAFMQAFTSFFIQLIFLLFLFFLYGFNPGAKMLLLPLLLLPLLLLTFASGLISSILNGIMRDIANLISALLTFALFLTPVFYIKPSHGILAKVTYYNPLYYLVCFPRNYILLGNRSDFNGFICFSLLSIILFFVLLFVFHLTETRVTERI